MFKILTTNKVKMMKINPTSPTYFDNNFNPIVGRISNLKIGEKCELVNDNNVWLIHTGIVTKIELVTNNQITIHTQSGSVYALLIIND